MIESYDKCPDEYINFACDDTVDDPLVAGYGFQESDGFQGTFLDLRTKQGFGQYANFIL